MDVGDLKRTKKPHKITVRGKRLNPRRVKAEPMSQKSFDDCKDTMQECIRNSKDIKSEDISRGYEQRPQFDNTPSWLENQQSPEVADGSRVDAGPKTLVEIPSPRPQYQNALFREVENIYKLGVQTEQEPTKRKTSSDNPVQGARSFEQETYAQLEANIKKLQKENSMSCHNMQEISESCAQLREENRHLLKQLKKVCPPDTIAYLEAKDPDTKVGNLGSPQLHLNTM